jgi:hypothetical protein
MSLLPMYRFCDTLDRSQDGIAAMLFLLLLLYVAARVEGRGGIASSELQSQSLSPRDKGPNITGGRYKSEV